MEAQTLTLNIISVILLSFDQMPIDISDTLKVKCNYQIIFNYEFFF